MFEKCTKFMLHQPIHKEMKILSLFLPFIEHRIT